MMKVSEERKQNLFRSAREMLQRGKPLKALIYFDRIIDLQFRLVDAYFLRGRTRYELGDFIGAIHDYNMLIAIDSENAGAYNNRANAQVALGEYEQARDDYNFAVEYSGGDSPLIYSNRGLNWLNLGMHVNAFEDFTKAIKIDPDYSRAYYFRGNIEAKHFNFKNALTDFNRAIELEPDFSSAFLKRGNVYLYFGDIEYGNSGMTHGAEFLSYAFWHLDEHKGLFRNYPFYYDKALEDFTRAIELNPDMSESYVSRASVRLRMSIYFGIEPGPNDLHQKAREDALKAIELTDGDFGFYALACAEARLGEVSLAIQHLDYALKLGEKSYEQVFNDRSWEQLLDNPHLSRIIQYYSPSDLIPQARYYSEEEDDIEGEDTFENPFDETFQPAEPDNLDKLTNSEREFLDYLMRLSNSYDTSDGQRDDIENNMFDDDPYDEWEPEDYSDDIEDDDVPF